MRRLLWIICKRSNVITRVLTGEKEEARESESEIQLEGGLSIAARSQEHRWLLEAAKGKEQISPSRTSRKNAAFDFSLLGSSSDLWPPELWENVCCSKFMVICYRSNRNQYVHNLSKRNTDYWFNQEIVPKEWCNYFGGEENEVEGVK